MDTAGNQITLAKLKQKCINKLENWVISKSKDEYFLKTNGLK